MPIKFRLFAAAMAALIMMMTLLLFPIGGSRADAPDDVLRLHILANSDSAADQAVKLAVRDAVLEQMPATQSREDAESWLKGHGRLILQTAESVLREQGFAYGAQLLLGISYFPDRVYGETVYPAGEYYALRIILGNGAGHNWWCVLFPPLCIVTKDTQPLPASDELEFESTLLNWWRALRNNHVQ